MVKRIIVIGSGAQGMTAASTARNRDPKQEINLFTEDIDIAYSPCAIPWVIEGKCRWDDIIMHPASFYEIERRIIIHTKTTVDSVDSKKNTIIAGGLTYNYDSLIIATGSKVFIPPISGSNLKNVFVVKTIQDGKNIQKALYRACNIVIAGAGVIGLELAVSLRRIGMNVVLVEMMNQVIPRIADKDMADYIQHYLESEDIKFVIGKPIQSINGENRVLSVSVCEDEYPCDIMIFATGVRPNIDIPKSIGLDIGPLGTVFTQPTMQPYKDGRLVSNIYIAGDIVQCKSAVVPGITVSQLGSTAVKQGQIAGNNATCADKQLFSQVASPWVSVIGNKQIAGTGLSKQLALWYGINVIEGKAYGLTCARYYPEGSELIVKVLADRTSHRLIGAQIISEKETVGRINWLTSAIINGMTVEGFIISSENAYCPPVSMVKDVVISAVEDLYKKIRQ